MFRKCNVTPFFIQAIHFITSLEGSHSGLAERIPVSQNRDTCLNIFRLLLILIQIQSSIFNFLLLSIFQHFGRGLCRFLLSGYDTLCLTSWSY